MHFHLPKPLHGWREFAGEVAIIVLGVLIALGAEQLVENTRDHRLAAETRASVTDEIDNDLTALQLRMTAEPCMGRRLGELHALVEDWGRTGSYKTPLWVAQAPRLDVPLPHYETAESSGHLALLPREEQYRIGDIVEGLRDFDKTERAETDAWATLRMVQSGAVALSVNDRTIIREALQRAANLDYTMRLQQHQLLPEARGWGFKPDLHRFNQQVKRIWKSGHYTPAICAPIDMPAPQANALTGQVTPLPF